PDWDEFWAVVKGDGPCNAQRLAHRKRAWDEGAWVREAALAFAENQAAEAASPAEVTADTAPADSRTAAAPTTPRGPAKGPSPTPRAASPAEGTADPPPGDSRTADDSTTTEEAAK